MPKRHGVWRCQCGNEIYAKPSKIKGKHHSVVKTHFPRDKADKWTYEEHNDRFFHRHSGEIGWLKADFVEDRDGGGKGQDGRQRDSLL